MTNLKIILNADKMSPAMSRYWLALAKKTTATVIDPFRSPLRTLRETLPAGIVVYRASTGGKYGKSAQLVTI